ncbi:MAG TPA: malectin domain-containing carbohydrate-binding protein, partial [Thermoguttaceae bacterium]|nr:malectin domain-containing carbohydrate-binding protein [Thermoguttaceae bacterium]
MRLLVLAFSSAFASAALSCDGDPPKVPGPPAGFDVCETPLDGDEGQNGFDLLAQVDVGRTEADGGEDDEGEPSPFALDRPYGAETGYGWVGSSGEAAVDPSWTTWAWPYGGRGDPRIHLATRAGMGGYRFDVPNGVYAVTWHFIEKPEHWSGFRKADLLVEGEVAVAGYDIFEEVGNRFMATIRALAEVEDGRLDLEFVDKGSQSPPILSALEVEAIDPDTAPPADVTDLEARGGYEQAILTWEFGPERDLRGANVWRAATAGGPWTRVNPRVVTARHFVDHGLPPGSAVYYKVVAQDLFCNDAPGAVTGPVFVRDHLSSSLPVFDIRLSASALAGLTEDVSADEYVEATLLIDGQQLPIEIRNRGASTRYLSKQNFKIRIEDGLTFEGRNGFKLNSEVVDPL